MRKVLGILILLSLLITLPVAAGPGSEVKEPETPAVSADRAPVNGACGVEAGWPGPDGYGYLGETIAFDWVDIEGTGTAVYLTDDDWDGPFPIGFTFSFYGTAWDQFYTGSNGFISFGAGSTSLSNQCPLPSSTAPDNLIALMWDDLDPGDTSDAVYYESFDPCPTGSGACLVVQYENFHHYPGGGAIAGTFEAILFASGEIIIQFEDAGAEEGSGSTTGIEDANAGGDWGLTYACNVGASLTDGLAIKIGFPEGLYLMPEEQGGRIEPGSAADFDLTLLNMTGMEEMAILTYTPSGPGTCYGPGISDPIPDGESWPFQVTVEMDPGAGPGDAVDCDVWAFGVYSGMSDSAWIHAEAAFPGEAMALDVYPGYQLVEWPDLDIPGTWDLIGPVTQFHPAGDFLGDDFSQMYALDYDTNQFVSIDTATGARTVIGTSIPTGNWTGMTGTADGSTLYASSSTCGTQSYLYEVNPASGALTLIGPMRAGSCMIDIAINAAGEMYGVDIVDDSLYSINTSTGAATYIGSTGASANYAQGMDFDFDSGTLYWASYTTQGELRTINVGTGMSTLIGPFPGGNEVDALSIRFEAEPEFTIHVEDIVGLWSGPYLVTKVEVADQDGVPMGNVLVDATVTTPNLEWARWRFTRPSGWARFWAPLSLPGTYGICVDDLTLGGYVYDPNQNVYDCMYWDYP